MAYDSTIYNSIIDKVANILEGVKAEMQAEMQAKGINASGRTSSSLRVERYEAGVRLVMGPVGEAAPLATLEVGRKGGKVPSGFVAVIEQWSRDKGLTFPSDGDRRRFSYLTARKIAMKGTRRYEKPVEVYSEAVSRGAEEVRKLVAAEVTQYVHDGLTDIIPH